MKKQIVIQLKETLSSLPTNIKLHFITWFGDNLSDDIDSCMKQFISLFYPAHFISK
ncbi:MAG: hypothetical protein ACTS73_07870 [Arsenophonus sp. NEOnobi-MAG3]